MKQYLKKTALFVVFAFAVFVQSAAQSAYISSSPYDKENTIGDLDGAGGVLVLSQRNDLVITVVNASHARISAPEKRKDGLYEYEVIVDPSETREPKIEVNRRGDVNKTDFTVLTKPDFFYAYLVSEVQKPIRLENQTAPNDGIMDAKLAQVEFHTTISNLKIECSELIKSGAKLESERKKGDNSITVYSITIPVQIFDDARQKLAGVKQEHEALRKRIVDDPNGAKKASDKDWERLDQLEADENAAAEELASLTSISVFAEGTNLLPLDISNLGPRSKMVFGVLALKVVEKVHASVCAGFMEEGGRLFALREYDNARRAFSSALEAKDTPIELVPTIKTSIAQCDSCSLYEKLALSALTKMKGQQKGGEANQAEVVKYATAASEFLSILNRYNPNEFYSSRIEKLNIIIESQPLTIKFTMVEWRNDFSGFGEGRPLGNVEVWAYYGDNPPAPLDYRDDKRFKKLVSDSNYRQEGESNEQGMLDLEFNRKKLPAGLLFRPVGYGKLIQIYYKDMQNIMRQSQGTYTKRQYRLKMYVAKDKK
jgi:hypothetical protein